MATSGTRRLESWKEIAQYLGHEVRTVIRWEKERALPVHRLPGGKRAGVFAYPDEIDRWVNGAPPREPAGERSAVPGSPFAGAGPASRRADEPRAMPFRLVARAARGPWVVTSAVVTVGVLAALVWSFQSGHKNPPFVAGLSLEYGKVVAKGADGSVLWRHDFGRSFSPVSPEIASAIQASTDLDGDAIPEHLLNIPWSDPAGAVPHELFCFTATGRPLWSVRLADELVFGGGRYGPPWVGAVDNSRGRLIAVFEIQGQQRIAWAQNHETWWPAILTVLDARGQTISKWIHAGQIRAVASLGGAPPRLLVVGTSNSRAAAFLAVLDARDVSGSGPEEPGSRYECLSCPPGRPLRYFAFKPSELTLADLLPYNHGVGLKVLPGGFQVQTLEAEGSFRLTGIFSFSEDFQLRHAAWSDGWLPTHRRFEREGKVDHPAEACPEAKRPPRVLEWDPGKGFHEVPGSARMSPQG